MLNQSGLAWTALRNGFYAAYALDLMGDALGCGMIEAPADGKVSRTAPASSMPGHRGDVGLCTSAVQENPLTPLRPILKL